MCSRPSTVRRQPARHHDVDAAVAVDPRGAHPALDDEPALLRDAPRRVVADAPQVADTLEPEAPEAEAQHGPEGGGDHAAAARGRQGPAGGLRGGHREVDDVERDLAEQLPGGLLADRPATQILTTVDPHT